MGVGERFCVKVTSAEWGKKCVTSTVTITFAVTGLGIRCCAPGCQSPGFGETKKNNLLSKSTTGSLFHCHKHVLARHSPGAKLRMRSINSFFHQEPKRARVAETQAVDDPRAATDARRVRDDGDNDVEMSESSAAVDVDVVIPGEEDSHPTSLLDFSRDDNNQEDDDEDDEVECWDLTNDDDDERLPLSAQEVSASRRISQGHVERAFSFRVQQCYEAIRLNNESVGTSISLAQVQTALPPAPPLCRGLPWSGPEPNGLNVHTPISSMALQSTSASVYRPSLCRISAARFAPCIQQFGTEICSTLTRERSSSYSVRCAIVSPRSLGLGSYRVSVSF